MVIAQVLLPDGVFVLVFVLAFMSGAGSIGVWAYWRATHAARRLLDLLDELTNARADLLIQQEEFRTRERGE
jgi:hypothetical protein